MEMGHNLKAFSHCSIVDDVPVSIFWFRKAGETQGFLGTYEFLVIPIKYESYSEALELENSLSTATNSYSVFSKTLGCKI